jgi:hypothetical protein
MVAMRKVECGAASSRKWPQLHGTHPSERKLIECHCNAENSDEAGPLSANISEYQPAFSLLWSSLSREKPRIAVADVDRFAVLSLY